MWHPLLIRLSYSRCQRGTGTRASHGIQPSFSSVFQCVRLSSIGKNESRCQYRHGHTLTHTHMHTLIHSPYLMESGMRITCKHFIFIPRRGLDGRFRARHISRFSRPSPLVAVLSLRSSIVVKWSRRLFLLCWARAYRTLSAAWNCLIPTGTPCAWKCDGWMALCSEAPRILNCIGNRFADLIQNQTLIKLWTCKKQYSFTQSHCVSINVSDAHFVVSYSVRSMVMAKLELTSTKVFTPAWIGCCLFWKAEWEMEKPSANMFEFNEHWPASCYQKIDVSLGKTLNPMLLLAWQPPSSVYESMNELLKVALDKSVW